MTFKYKKILNNKIAIYIIVITCIHLNIIYMSICYKEMKQQYFINEISNKYKTCEKKQENKIKTKLKVVFNN